MVSSTETITSGWRRIARRITQPTAIPIAEPPTAASTKSRPAITLENDPALAAVTATLNPVRPVASLISDSPWTSSRTRSGTRTLANVATAATASVGATTAPSMNAAGHDRPSTSPCDAAATAVVVTTTSASASSPSARPSALSSRGEEYQPAESNSGGTKTSRTTSGSMSTFWIPGTKASPSPASTRTIGYGTLT